MSVDPAGRGSSASISRSHDDLARVRVQLAARVADATRLGTLGSPLRRMTDIQSALDEVLRTVTSLLGADSGVLMLYDVERDELFPRASLGVPPSYLEALSPVRRPVGAVGTGLATVEPLVMADVRLSPLSARYADAAELAGVRAIYSTPLLTLGQELMGTIAVFFREPHAPTPAEIEVVEAYARQAAEMVERARMHGEARELASLERRRTHQLRRLAEAALALSSCSTLDELLRILTESARDVIGAHQGVASRLVKGWDDATTYVSLSEKYAPWRDYNEVPRGRGVLTFVTRENKPLRLSYDELVRHADWRGLRDSPAHPPLPNYLAAPLIARDGRNLGLVQLADKIDSGEFSADDEAMLVQLAQMASVAIENLELVERERAARQEAERLARLRGLLADASQRFAASLELDETLRTISSLTIPELADWTAVHLLDEGGRPELAYVVHDDHDTERLLLASFRASPPSVDDPDGVGAVIRTGEPRLLAGDGGALFRGASGPALPVSGCVIVPLAARGRTFGALSLGRGKGDPYTDAELLLARELGDRAALAVDNAARFAFERELAATLQRSLLPQALPVTPVVETAYRYLPGASGARIGGDWYDVMVLDDGRVAMVVGDVMGRGIGAAAVMGQLRAAVRAYALDGHSPAALLARLDRMVEALGETQLTTCLYAVYDVDAGTLTASSAGHLPPLLSLPGGERRYVELDPGMPLGVPGAEYVETTIPVTPGTMLLLYTDGLVEGRDCSIDEGLAALAEAVASAPDDLNHLCDHVLKTMGRDGDHDDDTAMLAVRLYAAPAESRDLPTLELAPVAESVAMARHFVAEQLAGAVDTGLVETAELLVSELVTNAVRHARTSLAVRLVTMPRCVRIDVTDNSPKPPAVDASFDEEAESGRGMMLVDALAQRWGYEPLLSGKRVWFELDLAM